MLAFGRLSIVVWAIVFSFVTQTAAQEIAKPAMQKVDGKIDWVYDYEKGKQLSEETGKPMFVVFRCER